MATGGPNHPQQVGAFIPIRYFLGHKVTILFIYVYYYFVSAKDGTQMVLHSPMEPIRLPTGCSRGILSPFHLLNFWSCCLACCGLLCICCWFLCLYIWIHIWCFVFFCSVVYVCYNVDFVLLNKIFSVQQKRKRNSCETTIQEKE